MLSAFTHVTLSSHEMRLREALALLLVSLVVGQPAGQPPANDDLAQVCMHVSWYISNIHKIVLIFDLAQAQWVRTILRIRSNHSL